MTSTQTFYDCEKSIMNIRLGSFASYSEDHFIKIDVTLGQGQKARKNGQINVAFLLGKSVLCCTELGRCKVLWSQTYLQKCTDCNALSLEWFSCWVVEPPGVPHVLYKLFRYRTCGTPGGSTTCLTHNRGSTGPGRRTTQVTIRYSRCISVNSF